MSIPDINKIKEELGMNITKTEMNRIMQGTDPRKVAIRMTSEDKKKLEEIHDHKIFTKEDVIQTTEELEELVGNFSIDPITGESTINTENIKVSDLSITEVLSDVEENRINYTDSLNYILGENIDENEMTSILKFIRKVEDEKPKKLYPIIPPIIRRIINQTVDKLATPEQLEFMARSFYDMCVSELKSDKIFIDLDKSLAKELDELKNPDYMRFYLDNIKEMMEIKLPLYAEKIKENMPDKAYILLGMSESFKESYTYTRLLDKIKHKKNIFKELDKENKNFKKLCNKINAKYANSKFIIINVETLPFILNRKLPGEYSIEDITRFLTLLFKSFRNLDIENMVNHTYIYYGIKCIASLDDIRSEDHEFKNIIIQNICNVINEINKTERK